MIAEFALWLEHTALAESLRSSSFLYPLLNAAHIAGVALLFGAIVPLDLRLIGFFRAVDLVALKTVLQRTSLAGFMLAVTTGFLLFSTDASDYSRSCVFRVKFALVLLATLNAAIALRYDAAHGSPGVVSWKIFATLSLLLWFSTLLAGRLIAYF